MFCKHPRSNLACLIRRIEDHVNPVSDVSGGSAPSLISSPHEDAFSAIKSIKR